MMHTDQLYFNKDHEMVRKAVMDFAKKEITPTVWGVGGSLRLPRGTAQENYRSIIFKA